MGFADSLELVKNYDFLPIVYYLVLDLLQLATEAANRGLPPRPPLREAAYRKWLGKLRFGNICSSRNRNTKKLQDKQNLYTIQDMNEYILGIPITFVRFKSRIKFEGAGGLLLIQKKMPNLYFHILRLYWRKKKVSKLHFIIAN